VDRVKVGRRKADGRAAVTVNDQTVGYVRRFEEKKISESITLKDHPFASTQDTWIVTFQFFTLEDVAGPTYPLLRHLVDARPWESKSITGG
jgi:hypothetical protein